MLALIVGDPHLQISRIDDAKDFTQKILRLIPGHERVIFLGDLFHTFGVIRSEILAIWHELFKECSIPSISLVGNHDYASQNGGNHALEVFSHMTSVVQAPVHFEGLHWLPFMRDARAFEEECRKVPKGRVLICHQSFTGAQFANGYFDPHGADVSCVAHLGAVISGHVHTRQQFGNIWYPGTPYQMNFGEAGEDKRVFTVKISENGYQVLKEHDLDMTRYVVIDGLTYGLPQEPDSKCLYKITGKGTPAEIASFWQDSNVKTFRAKARRVVDAMVPERGVVDLPGIQGTTQKERLDAFIQSRKWRTPVDKLCAAAGAFLSVGKVVS